MYWIILSRMGFRFLFVRKQQNGQCSNSGRNQKEVNPAEREALMTMLELIVQDRTVSQVAAELNAPAPRHAGRLTLLRFLDLLLVLGFLARRLGHDDPLGRHRPHPFAGYAPDLFPDIESRLLARHLYFLCAVASMYGANAAGLPGGAISKRMPAFSGPSLV